MKKIEKNNRGENVVCDDTRSYLLDELQNIQSQEGYISDENMQSVADKFNIHPVEVYSIVSFYSFLSAEKKGRHIIRVSSCMPCVMKGSQNVVKAFEAALGIKCGQTTRDGEFTLEKTSCIGMCDNAPAILLDDRLIGPVKAEEVQAILNTAKRSQ